MQNIPPFLCDFLWKNPEVPKSWACHHFDGVRSGKRTEIFVITTTSKALAAQTKAADQEINDQKKLRAPPLPKWKIKFQKLGFLTFRGKIVF